MNRIPRIWAGLLTIVAVPLVANAQLRPGVLDEEIYVGQPLPPGSRVERRANAAIVAVGVTTFVAAYVPWAVQGAELAANPPQNGTNWDHAFIWRAIPLAGPFIAIVDYNNRNATDCAAYMAHPMGDSTSGFMNAPASCDGSSFVTVGFASYPTVLTAHTATAGDWLWATTLASLQVAGIAITIWGLMADRYAVHDHMGSARATARRPMQWMLVPGAGNTPLGLTFSAINF